MSDTINNSSSGIGFCGLLAIVFIVLKLTNVIAWSWLWILAPLWIPLSSVLVVLIIMIIIAIVMGVKK